MAYYDAMIAEWALLTPGTAAQKLAQINALTVTGSVPTSFFVTGAQLANCVNWGEFAVLTAQKQSNLMALFQVPGQLLGGSANTTHLVDGMILDAFPVAGPTIANLTALAQAAVLPWWQTNGYQRPFDLGDVSAAGLS